MHFGVGIVRTQDGHWQCLSDAADGIQYSLLRLGHLVADHAIGTLGRDILFNAHRLEPGDSAFLAPETILFNAEQVQVNWASSEQWRAYLELLKRHVVWDYSQINIERLKFLGVERVVHCPIGYWPGLTRIKHTLSNQPIDVLFVGSMNPRREQVITDLVRRKIRAAAVFGVYGDERDLLLAQAKVVLNVHFYPQPIFEIFRCSYLWANHKCVVTESGGVDPEIEHIAADSCVARPYEGLAEVCEQYVKDANLRATLAAIGYERFVAHDQVEAVGRALEQS